MRKLILAFCLVFLTGSMFGQCNPPAGKLVLLVRGVAGSSNACPNGIDLSTARIVLGGTTKGSAAGTMTVTKAIDSSSPGLLASMAEGRHVPEIVLSVPAADGKSNTYMMSDSLLSSVRQSASPASETLTVSFMGFRGRQYQPAAAGNAASFVEVTGPGPYAFQGSAPAPGVQLSMKLDTEDFKISALTLTVNSRNRKVDMQMTVTSTTRDVRAESARPGANQFREGSVTLAIGSTPLASYLLEDIKVSSQGNQTSLAFGRIEFKFGSGVGANQEKFKYDLKNNKRA